MGNGHLSRRARAHSFNQRHGDLVEWLSLQRLRVHNELWGPPRKDKEPAERLELEVKTAQGSKHYDVIGPV